MRSDFLQTRAGWLLVVATAALLPGGCEPPPKAPPATTGQGSAPPVVSSPPTTGAPAPAGTAAAPAPAATGDASTIPPELIQKVNELVRLTKEYNALAAKIQTREDYVQNLDALSALDTQIEPYVIDLEIDQAKLAPAAQAEFDRKYFEGFAKPVVEEKRAHLRRFTALVQ